MLRLDEAKEVLMASSEFWHAQHSTINGGKQRRPQPWNDNQKSDDKTNLHRVVTIQCKSTGPKDLGLVMLYYLCMSSLRVLAATFSPMADLRHKVQVRLLHGLLWICGLFGLFFGRFDQYSDLHSLSNGVTLRFPLQQNMDDHENRNKMIFTRLLHRHHISTQPTGEKVGHWHYSASRDRNSVQNETCASLIQLRPLPMTPLYSASRSKGNVSDWECDVYLAISTQAHIRRDESMLSAKKAKFTKKTKPTTVSAEKSDSFGRFFGRFLNTAISHSHWQHTLYSGTLCMKQNRANITLYRRHNITSSIGRVRCYARNRSKIIVFTFWLEWLSRRGPMHTAWAHVQWWHCRTMHWVPYSNTWRILHAKTTTQCISFWLAFYTVYHCPVGNELPSFA